MYTVYTECTITY